MGARGSGGDAQRQDVRVLRRAIHRHHVQPDSEKTFPHVQRDRHHPCHGYVKLTEIARLSSFSGHFALWRNVADLRDGTQRTDGTV